jgi:hypothetical protein
MTRSNNRARIPWEESRFATRPWLVLFAAAKISPMTESPEI